MDVTEADKELLREAPDSLTFEQADAILGTGHITGPIFNEYMASTAPVSTTFTLPMNNQEFLQLDVNLRQIAKNFAEVSAKTKAADRHNFCTELSAARILQMLFFGRR